MRPSSILALALMLPLLASPALGAPADDPRPIVPASEILAKIERGEPVEYDGVIVVGDLDLTGMNLSTKNVERTKEEIEDMDLTEEVRVIESQITIINSEIRGDVDFSSAVFLKEVMFGEPFAPPYISFNFDALEDEEISFDDQPAEETTFNDSLPEEQIFLLDFDKEPKRFWFPPEFPVGIPAPEPIYLTLESLGPSSITQFNGSVNFWKANFTSNAYFERAQFSSYAVFDEANFNTDASFSETNFSSSANFRGARFSGNADFKRAIFNGDADLGWTKFSSYANFAESNFSRYAVFAYANFNTDASFLEAGFSDGADFSNALFSGDAEFLEANFSGDVNFFNARLGGDAWFAGDIFGGDACFGGTMFNGDAYFGGIMFNGDADFCEARFSGGADFLGAEFRDGGDFCEAKFSGGVYFWDAQFSSYIDFWGAQFGDNADFSRAQFGGDAFFEEAQFSKIATFDDTQFNHANLLLKDARIYILRFSDTTFENGSTISLEGTDYQRLYVNWDQIKDGFVYNGEAYLTLVKNFKILEYFEDADDCYYQYRRERQSMRSWLEVAKYTDIVGWVTCGYGVRPGYTLLLGLFVVSVSAVYYWRRDAIRRLKGDENESAKFSDAFYFSMVTFTTVGYGDWYPLDRHRNVVMIEGIVGWLTLSLFLVTLANVIIR